jgi:hypothetical protein
MHSSESLRWLLRLLSFMMSLLAKRLSDLTLLSFLFEKRSVLGLLTEEGR